MAHISFGFWKFLGFFSPEYLNSWFVECSDAEPLWVRKADCISHGCLLPQIKGWDVFKLNVSFINLFEDRGITL